MKVLIVKIKARKLAKQKKTYILNPDFYVEKSMRILSISCLHTGFRSLVEIPEKVNCI